MAYILVSEGLLDYDQPIAHIGLSLPKWQSQYNIASCVYPIKVVCLIFAIRLRQQQKCWIGHMLDVNGQNSRFAAGQSFAYQPLTYGWLVGGVIEKAVKQPLSWLMQRYLRNHLS